MLMRGCDDFKTMRRSAYRNHYCVTTRVLVFGIRKKRVTTIELG